MRGDLASLLTTSEHDVWDAQGGTVRLSREEWGVVTDALIEHAASSGRRKQANPASQSDLREDMCTALIGRLTRGASR